jgi:hypothetical protein
LEQKAVDAITRAKAIARAYAKTKAEADAPAVPNLLPASTCVRPPKPALVVPAPRPADAGGWRTVRRRLRTSP